MGLERVDFDSGMSELCMLTGIPKPPQAQQDLFFKKLCHFELVDFKAALNDDALISDLARARVLIYPRIREGIMFQQTRRQNTEHEKLKGLREDFERLPSAEVKKMVKEIVKK